MNAAKAYLAQVLQTHGDNFTQNINDLDGELLIALAAKYQYADLLEENSPIKFGTIRKRFYRALKAAATKQNISYDVLFAAHTELRMANGFGRTYLGHPKNKNRMARLAAKAGATQSRARTPASAPLVPKRNPRRAPVPRSAPRSLQRSRTAGQARRTPPAAPRHPSPEIDLDSAPFLSESEIDRANNLEDAELWKARPSPDMMSDEEFFAQFD